MRAKTGLGRVSFRLLRTITVGAVRWREPAAVQNPFTSFIGVSWTVTKRAYARARNAFLTFLSNS
jgi:hypothetical protein